MPDMWGGVEYPSWMDDANCVGSDPEAFFPDVGVNPRPAKHICQACQVQDECLDYALDGGDKHGVWGGTTEMERRVLRRYQQAA